MEAYLRGVKKPGATTKTSKLLGAFRGKDVRYEFLQLIKD